MPPIRRIHRSKHQVVKLQWTPPIIVSGALLGNVCFPPCDIRFRVSRGHGSYLGIRRGTFPPRETSRAPLNLKLQLSGHFGPLLPVTDRNGRQNTLAPLPLIRTPWRCPKPGLPNHTTQQNLNDFFLTFSKDGAQLIPFKRHGREINASPTMEAIGN